MRASRGVRLKLRALAGLLLIAAAPLVPGASRATADPQLDSHHQPLVDGCQRSNAMQLGLSTPEWVYVNHAPVLAARLAGAQHAGRQTVEGVVQEAHPAGDDLYVNHDFNDIDVDVAPDPAFAGLP